MLARTITGVVGGCGPWSRWVGLGAGRGPRLRTGRGPRLRTIAGRGSEQHGRGCTPAARRPRTGCSPATRYRGNKRAFWRHSAVNVETKGSFSTI